MTKPLRHLEQYLYQDKAGIAGFSPDVPYADVGGIKWAKAFEEQEEQKAYHLYIEL